MITAMHKRIVENGDFKKRVQSEKCLEALTPRDYGSKYQSLFVKKKKRARAPEDSRSGARKV